MNAVETTDLFQNSPQSVSSAHALSLQQALSNVCNQYKAPAAAYGTDMCADPPLAAIGGTLAMTLCFAI